MIGLRREAAALDDVLKCARSADLIAPIVDKSFTNTHVTHFNVDVFTHASTLISHSPVYGDYCTYRILYMVARQ